MREFQSNHCNTNAASNTGTRVVLKILFDVVDFDGDGEISAFELNAALTAFMSGSLAQRAKIAFVLFDSKRTGDLSRSDLTRILAAEICVSRRLGYHCTIDKDMSRSPFEIAKLHVEKYFDNITSPGHFSTFLEWYVVWFEPCISLASLMNSRIVVEISFKNQ